MFRGHVKLVSGSVTIVGGSHVGRHGKLYQDSSISTKKNTAAKTLLLRIPNPSQTGLSM